LFFIQRITHSPFGHVLMAVRENEPRAINLGYKTQRYKVLAFVLSAGLSSLASAMKVLVFQLASLTDVHWHASGEVVLMNLLGGMGTVLGPVVWAFLVVAIQNYFAQVRAWVTIIQGAIFVAWVLTFRRGIVGELREWRQRRDRQEPDAGPPCPDSAGGRPERPIDRAG
jgi:branched-chain amino acid transport system permease protein